MALQTSYFPPTYAHNLCTQFQWHYLIQINNMQYQLYSTSMKGFHREMCMLNGLEFQLLVNNEETFKNYTLLVFR